MYLTSERLELQEIAVLHVESSSNKKGNECIHNKFYLAICVMNIMYIGWYKIVFDFRWKLPRAATGGIWWDSVSVPEFATGYCMILKRKMWIYELPL